jgi:sodium/potassium-transporting ATPase subunit alpha
VQFIQKRMEGLLTKSPRDLSLATRLVSEDSNANDRKSLVELQAPISSDTNNKLNQDITEHQLSPSELASLLNVDLSRGLTESEAEARLLRDGPNALTPPKRTPLWLKFLGHLIGGFALLLWAGSVLCFIVYGIDGDVANLTLGIVLAAVVIVTGIFSFYQEFKSDSIMAGFLKLSATECDVFREGVYR